MWVTFALIAYAGMAVVSILDKFIISNQKILPSVFVFYSTIFLLPLNLGFFFLPALPAFRIWFISIFSAIMYALGLWTMYRALQKSEISHVGPFIGGLIPLLVLVLSRLVLKENISTPQIFGILLLSFGSFIISYWQDVGTDAKTVVTWALFSVLGFSFSSVASKYVYDQAGFVSGFVSIWGFMGLIGLVLLVVAAPVRKTIFPGKNISANPDDKLKIHGRKINHELSLLVADKSISAIGILLVQYAVYLGSVTRVYALAGVQYGLLIILVALLSKFEPKLFKEKYEAGEMNRELLAVLLIVAGLVLVV